MLLTRKRRAGSVRGTLLEAVAKTEGLGLTVVGVYDALVYASTSSWVDARGTTSGGPTISFPNGVSLANGVYTFNGTDQYGRAENGRLTAVTANALIVCVGSFASANSTSLIDLSAAGTTRALGLRRSSGGTLNALAGSASAFTAAPGAGLRVMYARRSGTGTVTAGVKNGAVAEATASAATADVSVSRLTVAGSLENTPSTFTGMTCAAVVVAIGVTDANVPAAHTIWNQYGALRGATL